MEEHIIEFMRENELMFNKNNIQYKCAGLKEKKWRELATELKTEVHTVKRKWKGLKDSFFREDAKHNLPSGSGAPASTTGWKYYQQLMFLKASREPRATHSNLSEDNCRKERGTFKKASASRRSLSKPGPSYSNETNCHPFEETSSLISDWFLSQQSGSSPLLTGEPDPSRQLREEPGPSRILTEEPGPSRQLRQEPGSGRENVLASDNNRQASQEPQPSRSQRIYSAPDRPEHIFSPIRLSEDEEENALITPLQKKRKMDKETIMREAKDQIDTIVRIVQQRFKPSTKESHFFASIAEMVEEEKLPTDIFINLQMKVLELVKNEISNYKLNNNNNI